MEEEEEESGASSLSSLALCLPVLLHLSLSPLIGMQSQACSVLQCEFVSAAARRREGDRTAVAGGVSSSHTCRYIHTSCAAPGKPFLSHASHVI